MHAFSPDRGPLALPVAVRGPQALRYAASGLSLLAALVHIWAMPEHLAAWWGYGVFFFAVALVQALYGVALPRRRDAWLLPAGVAGTLGLLALHVTALTIGVPFVGPYAGHAEAFGAVDLAAMTAEAALLAALVGLALGQRTTASVCGDGEAHHRDTEVAVARRLPLRWVAVSVAALAGLAAAGYGAAAALPLSGEQAGGAITISDAAACARQPGCDVSFSATLITAEQAERMGIAKEVAPRLRTAQAFVVGANTHTGTIRSLSLDGKVFLRTQGEVYPAAGQPLQVSNHHNAYLVFFPKYDMHGRSLFDRPAQTGGSGQTSTSAIHVHAGVAAAPATAPEPQFTIIVRDIEGGLPEHILDFNSLTPAAGGLTWAALLGLLGGFMAAMWPCLFQLTAYFIPSLAGISMQQAQQAGALSALRWRVVTAALYFGAGIVLVYTAAGALAGYAAQSFEGAPWFETLRRPLGIGAGLFIIAMAVRMAAQARLPLVCRMPMFGFRRNGVPGPVATMITGVAFATGCMSCFGAVMALGMLTYSASTGSAAQGALLLFVFSLGITIPLVIGAAAMAQVLPLLVRLERWTPALGLASSAVMVGFGLLLLTDNYHVVSDLIAKAVGAGWLFAGLAQG